MEYAVNKKKNTYIPWMCKCYKGSRMWNKS